LIPLRLTVKNFMCYRDNVPTLDLESIHIACLCGENGHGKSALLDAITWALWGHARTNRQDELIHQGQSDVSVELEFLARDQQYKVVRSHIRSGRSRQGKTDLNLSVSSRDGFKAITGNTIRDTEARIRELLHMDYETFINTAFLVQGQADLFTTANSSERKNRLAEVLDLSYYERLERVSKQQSRMIQQRVQDAESKLAVKREEVEQRPEHEDALSKINSEVEELAPKLDSLRKAVESYQRTHDEMQTRAKQVQDSKHRLLSLQEEIHTLEKREVSHSNQIAAHQKMITQQTKISTQFETYQKVRAESECLTHSLATINRLSHERSSLAQQIAAEEARLQAEMKTLDESIKQDLEPKSSHLASFETKLQEAEKDLSDTEDADQQLQRASEQANCLTKHIAKIEQTILSLKVEMAETRSKFDLLDKKDATCPICQQQLGPEATDLLRAEYQARGHQARTTYNATAEEVAAKQRESEAISIQRAQDEKDLAQRRAEIYRRIEGLERDLKVARRANEMLPLTQDKLVTIKQLLQSDEFAPEERRRLKTLQRQVDKLGYDEDRHRSVMEQTQSLEPYVELYRRLQEADQNLSMEQQSRASTNTALKRLRDDEKNQSQALATLGQDTETVPTIQRALETTRKSLRESEVTHNEALRRQGALRELLARCDTAELETRGLEADRLRLLDEKSMYDELDRAFGPNGIPALIIETAIPQLESDANELLGRLTDGRMALKLELHEGRKQRGVPSETLDIKIADEVGTRSYETFSGGEAFRINFALRIALSKLLARRSGAPLPILFIDEGFGSQDASGQERLKESIQSIQDDFKKILVITHIPDIKEAFPVRIEVTKTSEGSTFHIT